METIRLTATVAGLGFETALARAKAEAAARKEDPMLVAWYDVETGHYSPSTTCCKGENPVGCYADARGSDLTVEAEGGKYHFYFR